MLALCGPITPVTAIIAPAVAASAPAAPASAESTPTRIGSVTQVRSRYRC
jgi:hypothetical protein